MKVLTKLWLRFKKLIISSLIDYQAEDRMILRKSYGGKIRYYLPNPQSSELIC